MTPNPDGPTTVVVVDGGEPPHALAVGAVPEGAFVIAADSGADHALSLGLGVDLLVGDLDSVSDVARRTVQLAGGAIRVHPAAKDETDLVLALREAAAMGPNRIIVMSGEGGRVDHELVGLALLGAEWLAPVPVTAWHGSTLVTVVRGGDRADLAGAAGSLMSLVPLGGLAEGITTSGLEFPLEQESLAPGTTRGVSNVFVDTGASVSVGHGVLLAMQPDAIDRLEVR